MGPVPAALGEFAISEIAKLLKIAKSCAIIQLGVVFVSVIILIFAAYKNEIS